MFLSVCRMIVADGLFTVNTTGFEVTPVYLYVLYIYLIYMDIIILKANYYVISLEGISTV